MILGHRLWILASSNSHYESGIAIAGSMAILALAIHSAADFNLQIPANAVTLIVLAAIHYRSPGRAPIKASTTTSLSS